MAVMTLLTCAACQKSPRSSQAATSKPTQVVKQDKTPSAPIQQSPPPQQFGFNVVSVQKLLCCSDVPGEPSPIPYAVVVEGLTNDGERFLVDCYGAFKVVKAKGGYQSEPFRKDDWYALHVASIEHSENGEEITIYQWDIDAKGISSWGKMVECSVRSHLERARNISPIRVVSSKLHESNGGTGYEIEAWSAQEVYMLSCAQGVQTPCVSLAPATYRGVRDGSEIRLCDQDLDVIGTYMIESERVRP